VAAWARQASSRCFDGPGARRLSLRRGSLRGGDRRQSGRNQNGGSQPALRRRYRSRRRPANAVRRRSPLKRRLASAVSLGQRLRIDAHAAWLTARDPRTPRHARALGLFIAAYALSPIDLIPDFIPILGLLDDAVLIPAGIWLFVKMVPPELFQEHRATAEAAAERPGSAWGAVVVIVLWILAALLVARLLGFD